MLSNLVCNLTCDKQITHMITDQIGLQSVRALLQTNRIIKVGVNVSGKIKQGVIS